jgi:hypothetical protein
MAKKETDSLEIVPRAAIKSERHESYRKIYANTVRTSVMPWDIQYTFGVLESNADGTPPTMIEMATVIASPQQAKAFAALMQRVVSDYEAKYGPISLPPALISPDANKEKN